MNILFVAKHGPQDNADEDAITHALTQLGHMVTCLHEKVATPGMIAELEQDSDFLLFLKWEDVSTLAKVRIPKVGWCFDLIESNDWDLQQRSKVRAEWARAVAQVANLLFFTDGDWVANHQNDSGNKAKLRWLMQGADERFTGPGKILPYVADIRNPRFGQWDDSIKEPPIDILFLGSTIHGGKRISHIRELQEHYGPRFVQFGHHPKERRHGRELADIVASAKVIVAPDGPVTDRYWSNRVYLITGFQGYLIHPYCSELEKHYDGDEVPMYTSREDCIELIDTSLRFPVDCQRAAKAAYERTIYQHLYRHRCMELIQEVEKIK